MFYNEQISILGVSDGYTDDMGIYHSGSETIMKTIPADVQPVTKKEAYENFGYQDHCTNRVFCDSDNLLKIDSKILYNGNIFKIVQIIEWNDYFDMLIDNIGGDAK